MVNDRPPDFAAGGACLQRLPQDETRPAVDEPAPSWITLRLHEASVAIARRFARDVVTEHTGDDDHAHTVLLLVSELVTNGLRAACALAEEGLTPPWRQHDRPVRLGLTATDRYVHVQVTDPDRRPIDPAIAPNPDPNSGWGLSIVDALSAARWTSHAPDGKTVHVIVPAPGITLTPGELAALGAPAREPAGGLGAATGTT